MLAGRYTLRHQLGRGGMATVYEAHDDLLDRAVAVKLLRVDGEAVARQRFVAEARAAASLTHPHAVGVYDVNTDADRPFIVMELVRGDTLEDVLEREGSMDPTNVVAVGSQVLDALHAAHRRGLVHRDVKPANILLPDGVVPSKPEELPGVKLADFGIAKAMRDATIGLTMAGQVIGTPKYLSPEQVKGERATPQSDLYATAVVLYEMLAGRPPFEHDTAVGLALAHREEDPPPLDELRPGLSPSLVALVHQGLLKDPAQRPADAVEMREALLRGGTAASGTQLLASPEASTQVVRPAEPSSTPMGPMPPPGPVHPPRRRGRLLWWIALLAALGVAAVVFLTQLGDATDDPSAPEQPPAEVDGGQEDPDAGAGQEEPAPDQEPQEPEEPDPAPADTPAPDDAPDDAPDEAPAPEAEPTG